MDNHYTNTQECPTNFNRYLLHESIQTDNLFRQQCHRCGFLWMKTCCDDVPDGLGTRRLEFYGCSTNQKQLRSSGSVLQVSNNYVYGGFFTNEKDHLTTGTSKCPNEQFQAVPVTDSLRVCLAERVIDTNDLPHYGGMYSCDQGNIAFDRKKKECPSGYSAYVMGALEDGCLLTVCLKYEKFSDIREFPSVVLPPFFPIPLQNSKNRTLNAVNSSSETDTQGKQTTPIDNKLTLGLSIGGTGVGILVILLAIILLVRIKRRQWQSERSNYAPLV